MTNSFVVRVLNSWKQDNAPTSFEELEYYNKRLNRFCNIYSSWKESVWKERLKSFVKTNSKMSFPLLMKEVKSINGFISMSEVKEMI